MEMWVHPSASLLTSQVHVCKSLLCMSIHTKCMFSAGVSGVSDVSTNLERTVLQWNQALNTDYPDCITSYSIGWNGMTYNTVDTATSVTRELLSASGFPFCMSTSVTVAPVTPMGLLVGRDSTAGVSLISPGIGRTFCVIQMTLHVFHRFSYPNYFWRVRFEIHKRQHGGEWDKRHWEQQNRDNLIFWNGSGASFTHFLCRINITLLFFFSQGNISDC